MKTVKTV